MYRPFRRIGERLRPSRAIISYKYAARIRAILGQTGIFLRDYFNVHQSLVALTVFILISNALVVRAANDDIIAESQFVPLDPYEIADTVRLLAPHMSDITQDPDAIAVTLEQQVNGAFISTNPLIATLPGETDDPDILTTPQPGPTQAPSKRTADIKYTVEIGDTLSAISQAYSISVDTIRVKNSLKDADDLKPGQVLTIPPANLSQKAIAAADSRNTIAPKIKTISGAKPGGYGMIVPIHHNGITRRLVGGHAGVDYGANSGTAVYAATSGIVTIAERGWNGGFGTNVLVNHGSGMTTRYAHLQSFVVSPGQSVNKGQLIAYSGSTGRSTGPHLHFEMRINGVARDPGT